MPPDLHQLHAKLGAIEATLEAHERELDGLWKKLDDLGRKLDEHKEAMVKVRIQVAIIVAVGIFLGAVVQGVSISYSARALERNYQHRETR